MEADEAVQPVAVVEQLKVLAQLLVAIEGRDIDVDGGQRVEIDRGEAGVLAPRADRAERQRVGQLGRHVHRQTIGLHILFRVVEAGAGVVDIVEDRRPRDEAGDQDRKEDTSDIQSIMRISYAVFCLKKKNKTKN